MRYAAVPRIRISRPKRPSVPRVFLPRVDEDFQWISLGRANGLLIPRLRPGET
jgi:hypothetical protein